MPVIGVDLGGTKVSVAVFSEDAELIKKDVAHLKGRSGTEVGALIASMVIEQLDPDVRSVGICVPGISRQKSGTVWAPNIRGWDDYPLLEEMRKVCGTIPVSIDSDRACYILGEHWRGAAKGCRNAIFLAVGTGIGAGILIDGVILRGAHDIAGAIGWLAVDRKFDEKYKSCGNFEFHASGDGLARIAREKLDDHPEYAGELSLIPPSEISAADVFNAYENRDLLATQVMLEAVDFWGRAVANLISLFNPEKIILGGGVFGPGLCFINDIRASALKWAQPISATQVLIEGSALHGDAGVYGAGFLALQNLNR